MIKIEYNKSKCISCGYCYDYFPERWTINTEDGKAELYDSIEINGIFYVETINEEYEKNIKISKMCTGKAIKILNKK